MEEEERWVPKTEAAREMEISLSTLDRRIKKEEVEVFREGRRVFVRMHEPEQLSDERLLRRAMAREVELKRTVEKLERNVTELEHRATELERERDEAREALSAGRRPYEELKERFRKEKAAHKDSKEGLIAVQVTSFILLALLVGSVLLWWFVLR